MAKETTAPAVPAVAPVVAIVAPDVVEDAASAAATVKNSRFRDRLGGLLVGGFLSSLLVMFFVGIPEANTQIVTYMIGQLSGFAASVVAFHYVMNSANAAASANTGRAFNAIAAAQKGSNGGG